MSSDGHLQGAVLAELGWDPSVNAAHIGVTANAGVVTLTGQVESFAEKHAAETAAHRVRGVIAVAEDIVVQVPFERTRGDEDIAAAAVERLAWDTSVTPGTIFVTVADGWVTLTGTVAWFYQKEAAFQDLVRLQGVRGVSNQIVVEQAVDVTGIGVAISHALHRSWLFDNQNISVTADGNHIHLRGTVRSPAERQLAFAAAWSAPGVTRVVNDIEIN